MEQRQEFLGKFDSLTQRAGLQAMTPANLNERGIKSQAFTKAHRAKLLEKFVRVTFAHVSVAARFPSNEY